MAIEQFLYLSTILLFAGGGAAIGVSSYRGTVRRNARILLAVVLIAIVYTIVSEPVALRWSAWSFNPAYTLDVSLLGTEIETYLYAILVGIAISVFTLVSADKEESGEGLRSFFVKRGKKPLRPSRGLRTSPSRR